MHVSQVSIRYSLMKTNEITSIYNCDYSLLGRAKVHVAVLLRQQKDR